MGLSLVVNSGVYIAIGVIADCGHFVVVHSDIAHEIIAGAFCVFYSALALGVHAALLP